MKPNTEAQNFVLTNAVESKKMGIDVASTAHIISLLTDLYSNKILAVIREYSTNAWDSHAEAGNPDPIHVKTPNRSEPNFVVRDYGVGLSKDDITDIYSMYGTSTKQHTNEAVGMLGLGCKSGLTYAAQFTVDAVKDGMRTVAVVGKGGDGVGEIQILNHHSTLEPNGVTVTIPVEHHDIHKFNETIESFFYYWRDGVLVDGEVPNNITTDDQWTAIDPDVYISSSFYSHNHYLVQGNVAYRFEKQRSSHGNTIVAYVPIGMVDFTPSREDLHLTDRTLEVTAETHQFVDHTMAQTLRDELDQVRTDWGKLGVYMEWRTLLSDGHGAAAEVFNDLRRFRDFPVGHYGWHVQVFRSGYRHVSDQEFTLKRTQAKRFPIEQATKGNKDNAFFVRNFDLKSFTDSHYRRLLAAGMDEDVSDFYVIPVEYGKRVAMADFPGIDWAQVPELPRSKSNGGKRKSKAKTEYTVYRGGLYSQHETLETILGDDYLYLCAPTRKEGKDNSLARKVTQGTDKAVVLITPRQLAKLNRVFPKVQSIESWAEGERKRVEALITPEIKDILTRSRFREQFTTYWARYKDRITNRHILSNLDEREIDSDLVYEIDFWGLRPWDVGQRDSDDVLRSEMKNFYPLLDDAMPGGGIRLSRHTTANFIDHVIDYVNAYEPDGYDNDSDDNTDDNTDDNR